MSCIHARVHVGHNYPSPAEPELPDGGRAYDVEVRLYGVGASRGGCVKGGPSDRSVQGYAENLGSGCQLLNHFRRCGDSKSIEDPEGNEVLHYAFPAPPPKERGEARLSSICLSLQGRHKGNCTVGSACPPDRRH